MEKQKVFPCRYCERSFRSSKTMMAHMVLKKAELPCRFCSTMFTTNCACQYHAEVCPARPQPTTIEPAEPSITDAIPTNGTATRNGGTPKKESGMRSPVWLRESPVKVRDSPQKNGTPDSKRLKTGSPSPQKKSSSSAAATNPPLLPPQAPPPEIIQVIDEEAFSIESFEEKENKLAQILLMGNDEETYCPVCNCHFEYFERHGRSHGMAFLKYCVLKREKMTATSAIARYSDQTS